MLLVRGGSVGTDHSPYASTTVTGWPALTISRGTVVAGDGEPVDVETDRGRFLAGRRPYLIGS